MSDIREFIVLQTFEGGGRDKNRWNRRRHKLPCHTQVGVSLGTRPIHPLEVVQPEIGSKVSFGTDLCTYWGYIQLCSCAEDRLDLRASER